MYSNRLLVSMAFLGERHPCKINGVFSRNIKEFRVKVWNIIGKDFHHYRRR